MTEKSKIKIHYGWIILATATLAVFGALGLARFGYTTVLPSMQTDLGLDNGQAGLLATLNLTGYLAFSIIGGALAVRLGIRWVASLGLLLAGLSMVLTGIAQTTELLGLWRFLTGCGSGAANVAIMGLWSAWFSSKKRGLASGIAVSGSSIGLIVTGITVPSVIQAGSAGAWRNCWFLFGGITLFLAVGFYLLIRNNPGQVGLRPVGEAMTEQVKNVEKGTSIGWKQVYLSPKIWHLGLIYAAYGFSYIIYMTFFIKSLITDHGYSAGSAGSLFTMMGWFSLICGLLWGVISDKKGRKFALIVLFSFHAIAFSLFAAANNAALLTLSAILFGLSAWSIPAVMAAACGDILGQKMAPAAIGFVTLFFGIGQATGPSVAGMMADTYKSFSPAFYLAAAIALTGLFCSLCLKKSTT